MKYQCTECNIESSRYNDVRFDHCKFLRHTIMKFNGNVENDDDTTPVEAKRPDIYVTAEQIMQKYEFITTQNHSMWYYTDGYYRPDGENLIRIAARRIGYDSIKNNDISEIVGIIKDTTGYKDNDYFTADDYKYFCCITNGVLDLRNGKLLSHDKKYKFTARLPLYYDKTKSAPNFAKFLRTSLDADSIKVTTILEMIGHCLMRDNTRISKIFLHIGKGSNGKSVLFKIIQKMLHGFYSTKTIHSFTRSEFAGFEVINKHANICADIGSSEIKETDLLKRLSAGDAIDARALYKQGYPAVPYATMIFSANELPDVKDETDGFARRVEVIEWEKSFYGKDKDPMVNRISDMPDEISGILNMVLPIASFMIKRGALKHERTVTEMKQLYKEKSDSVYLFANNFLIDDVNNYDVTTKIYSEYVKFCGTKKYRILNTKTFSRKMKERGYLHEQKKITGKTVWCWIGTMLLSNKIDNSQTKF